MPQPQIDGGCSAPTLSPLGNTKPVYEPKLTGGLQVLQISALPASKRLTGVDILRGMSAESDQHIAQADIEARLVHGADPCTRAQAAAHEAGHLLVAYAVGEQVSGARIARRQEHGRAIWLGCAQYGDSAQGTRVVQAATHPELALRSAAINLAGFLGEEFAGLSHPASSIDERYMATVLCSAVAKSFGLEPNGVGARVESYCIEVLTRNRMAFDVMRGHLYRAKRLSQSDALRMLARVAQSAPAWLGGAR